MGILRPPKVKSDLEPGRSEIEARLELPVGKPTISLPATIAEAIKTSRALVSRSRRLRAESERRIDATLNTIESCGRN